MKEGGDKEGEWMDLMGTGVGGAVVGSEAGMRPLHWGQSAGTEGKHLRLSESEAADLWQSERSESHPDSVGHGPTYPRQERKSIRLQAATEVGHSCRVTPSRWSQHCSLPLPTCWLWQLPQKERSQWSPFESLMHGTMRKTPASDVLSVPVVLSDREGPAREALWVPAVRG